MAEIKSAKEYFEDKKKTSLEDTSYFEGNADFFKDGDRYVSKNTFLQAAQANFDKFFNTYADRWSKKEQRAVKEQYVKIMNGLQSGNVDFRMVNGRYNIKDNSAGGIDTSEGGAGEAVGYYLNQVLGAMPDALEEYRQYKAQQEALAAKATDDSSPFMDTSKLDAAEGKGAAKKEASADGKATNTSSEGGNPVASGSTVTLSDLKDKGIDSYDKLRAYVQQNKVSVRLTKNDGQIFQEGATSLASRNWDGVYSSQDINAFTITPDSKGESPLAVDIDKITTGQMMRQLWGKEFSFDSYEAKRLFAASGDNLKKSLLEARKKGRNIIKVEDNGTNLGRITFHTRSTSNQNPLGEEDEDAEPQSPLVKNEGFSGSNWARMAGLAAGVVSLASNNPKVAYSAIGAQAFLNALADGMEGKGLVESAVNQMKSLGMAAAVGMNKKAGMYKFFAMYAPMLGEAARQFHDPSIRNTFSKIGNGNGNDFTQEDVDNFITVAQFALGATGVVKNHVGKRNFLSPKNNSSFAKIKMADGKDVWVPRTKLNEINKIGRAKGAAEANKLIDDYAVDANGISLKGKLDLNKIETSFSENGAMRGTQWARQDQGVKTHSDRHDRFQNTPENVKAFNDAASASWKSGGKGHVKGTLFGAGNNAPSVYDHFMGRTGKVVGATPSATSTPTPAKSSTSAPVATTPSPVVSSTPASTPSAGSASVSTTATTSTAVAASPSTPLGRGVLAPRKGSAPSGGASWRTGLKPVLPSAPSPAPAAAPGTRASSLSPAMRAILPARRKHGGILHRYAKHIIKFADGGKSYGYNTGVKFGGNTSWYENVFKHYSQDILDRLQADKDEYGDWINQMQHTHSQMYSDANKSGDWSKTAFEDPSKRTGQYQEDYAGRSKTPSAFDFNNAGIAKAVDAGRYDLYGNRKRYSNDWGKSGWKSDNLYSSITDDRRILGRLNDWDEQSQVYKDFQSKLKEKNYEMYLDPTDNYYKLRRLSSSQTPNNPSTPPADHSNPPANSSVPNPSDANLGASIPEEKKNIVSKVLNSFNPDLGLGRLLFNNRETNRRTQKYVNSIQPSTIQPYQLYRKIYGDYATQKSYEGQGAKSMQTGERVASSTSNAQLGAAAQLAAQEQENQAIEKGRLADNQMIRGTYEQALSLEHNNTRLENEVANRNRASMVDFNNSLANIEAQRSAGIAQNWNTYLMEKEKEWKDKKAQKELIRQQVEQLQNTYEAPDFALDDEVSQMKEHYAKAVQAKDMVEAQRIANRIKKYQAEKTRESRLAYAKRISELYGVPYNENKTGSSEFTSSDVNRYSSGGSVTTTNKVSVSTRSSNSRSQKDPFELIYKTSATAAQKDADRLVKSVHYLINGLIKENSRVKAYNPYRVLSSKRN